MITPATPTSYGLAVTTLKSRLTPAALAQLDAVYAFHFTEGGTSTIDASRIQPQGYLECSPDALGLTPDFEVTLTREDFTQLITGQLHPMAGMATGRMKLKGDMRQAIKLDRILKS